MQIELNGYAQIAIDSGEPIESLGSSNGFWYDITKGGYFKPENVMNNGQQIEDMNKAIELVKSLEEIYNKVVEEF